MAVTMMMVAAVALHVQTLTMVATTLEAAAQVMMAVAHLPMILPARLLRPQPPPPRLQETTTTAVAETVLLPRVTVRSKDLRLARALRQPRQHQQALRRMMVAPVLLPMTRQAPAAPPRPLLLRQRPPPLQQRLPPPLQPTSRKRRPYLLQFRSIQPIQRYLPKQDPTVQTLAKLAPLCSLASSQQFFLQSWSLSAAFC